VLTDHDGLYGAVRFSQAAAELGIRAGYGAELSLDLTEPQTGVPDPAGTHLLVIARGLEGYRRLCRVISHAQLAGEKGAPRYDIDEVVDELRGHAQILTGCSKSAIRRAVVDHGPIAALAELRLLVDRFRAGNVAVELVDHGQPLDGEHNDDLAGMAAEFGLATVATGNVHYADPRDGRLAAALAAIRARKSLEEIAGWLPTAGMAFLRSGQEMARGSSDIPGRYSGPR
jgi:error-prone DNA polymerase